MPPANVLCRTLRGFALAAGALTVAGCATGMFTRDTVTLDSAQLGDYSIRYEPLTDCLLKQMVPAQYSVKRANYRLQLTIKPGYNEQPPRIEAEVGGSADLSLEFPGMTGDAPEAVRLDSGRRYTLNVANLKNQSLVIDVRGGGERLGQEQFSLHPQRCHGLSFQGA